jgi:hypothetical protein
VSLLHLVCFKYHADGSVAAQDDHRARLAALKDIDGITALKVGADVVRSPRSYDTGLAITFMNRAALDAYQIHPRHLPVAQFGVSLCDHIVAVDFEV